MRAEQNGDFIVVYDAYRIKESIKEIDGRRYNSNTKAWEVPLSAANAVLLQALGVELSEQLQALESKTPAPPTAPPLPVRYPVKVKPYAHQRAAAEFALKLYGQGGEGVAILADMGTGKTLITIAVAGVLFDTQRIKRLLIIAPKSIVGVWQEEYAKFADYDYTLAVLEGDSHRKADTIRNMTGSALQIVVVNYESAWRLEQELRHWKPDMVVCDESSKIKNAQAKQAKAVHGFGKVAKFKAILTGTPITNNPLDFFSQYKFVDASIFGQSYYGFRARYAILGGFNNHQIVGYKHLAELVEKAHSIAYRIRIEDAVELPDKIDEYRMIELEPKAAEIYRGIDKDSYAQLMQGEITIQNVLTRLLRLSQCTGGFIRDDLDGIIQQVSAAKLEALEDIIDACLDEDKKVVIFAQFVPEIRAIERMLRKKELGYSLISGEVKDRQEQVRQFQENDEVKVFVGQLATTGMGLTLTAATVAVFYSLSFSYENYKQSRARIHRIGQMKKCLYIHLVAKGTVDEKVIAALKQKGDVARLVVDEYKKIIGGQSGRE